MRLFVGGGVAAALLLLVGASLIELPMPSPPTAPPAEDAPDTDDVAWLPYGAEPSPSSVPMPPAASGRPFYLVISPESSGNRYMVQLLVAAGCRGRSGHTQPFDAPRRFGRAWPHRIDAAAAAGMRCAVVHRSMPHGGVWPNVTQLVADVRAAGWLPHVLTMVRSDEAVSASQVVARHAASMDMAAARIALARHTIVAAIGGETFDFVLYEQLGRTAYTDWLFGRRLGRPLPPSAPAFVDANAKYATKQSLGG